MEIWKDVEGYNGVYQVSNLGRVKSLNYGKERILKDSFVGPKRQQYKAVFLSKDCKKKTIMVHQLVAVAFLNHTVDGHIMVVNHKDKNTANNVLSNIEVVTPYENNIHRIDKKKTSSKFTGVSWSKSRAKWIAKIKIGPLQKYLGGFDCELKASEAYQTALNNK